jgi:hypothetical protein
MEYMIMKQFIFFAEWGEMEEPMHITEDEVSEDQGYEEEDIEKIKDLEIGRAFNGELAFNGNFCIMRVNDFKTKEESGE